MIEAVLQKDEKYVFGRDHFQTLGIISYLHETGIVEKYESTTRGFLKVDIYTLKNGGSISIDYDPSYNTSSLIMSKGVSVEIAETLKEIARRTRGGHTVSSNN